MITHVLDQDLNDLPDRSGVTVSFDGSGLSTTSDSTGSWTITGLPTRTYDITYSKPGYGTIHHYGYQFVGGGTAYVQDVDVTLEPPTQVSVTSLQAAIDDSTQSPVALLALNATPSVTATRQSHVYLLFVISRSSSSSIDNRTGAYTVIERLQIGSGARVRLLLSDLRSLTGVKSGETLYITAYAVSGRSFRPETGQSDFASHSAPATTSIVIP
jgi:hypothetical protein